MIFRGLLCDRTNSGGNRVGQSAQALTDIGEGEETTHTGFPRAGRDLFEAFKHVAEPSLTPDILSRRYRNAELPRLLP